MNDTTTFVTTLVTMECSRCGVPFGMSRSMYDQRVYDGEEFFCTNGHGQIFTKRRDLDAEIKELRMVRTHLRDQLDAAQKSAASYKGHLTRVKNRIANGVCPQCNRSFDDLRRHMTTEHGGGDDE